MSNSDYLFPIEDADNLYCHFDGVGNDICGINILDEEGVHKYTVTFMTPTYYSFPAKWKGAGFRLATKEEHDTFLQKVPSVKREHWTKKGLSFSEEYYKYQSLYVVDIDVDTDNPIQIQIVAMKPEIWPKD